MDWSSFMRQLSQHSRHMLEQDEEGNGSIPCSAHPRQTPYRPCVGHWNCLVYMRVLQQVNLLNVQEKIESISSGGLRLIFHRLCPLCSSRCRGDSVYLGTAIGNILQLWPQARAALVQSRSRYMLQRFSFPAKSSEDLPCWIACSQLSQICRTHQKLH